MSIHDVFSLLVDLPGQCPGRRVISEVHPGGRDREQARGDSEPVHEREVRFGFPAGHGHAVDHFEAGRTKGPSIRLGNKVGVHVHAPRSHEGRSRVRP